MLLYGEDAYGGAGAVWTSKRGSPNRKLLDILVAELNTNSFQKYMAVTIATKCNEAQWLRLWKIKVTQGIDVIGEKRLCASVY